MGHAMGTGPATSSAVLGRRGEQAAAQWYVDQDYEIVAMNWRCREGELDIVAARRGQIAFCEVKSRAHERFAGAAEAVDWRKQQRVRAAALQWLASQSQHWRVRFDVAVVISGRVDVIEAAF